MGLQEDGNQVAAKRRQRAEDGGGSVAPGSDHACQGRCQGEGADLASEAWEKGAQLAASDAADVGVSRRVEAEVVPEERPAAAERTFELGGDRAAHGVVEHGGEDGRGYGEAKSLVGEGELGGVARAQVGGGEKAPGLGGALVVELDAVEGLLGDAPGEEVGEPAQASVADLEARRLASGERAGAVQKGGRKAFALGAHQDLGRLPRGVALGGDLPVAAAVLGEEAFSFCGAHPAFDPTGEWAAGYNPTMEPPIHTTEHVRTEDGLRLYFQGWLPPESKPEGLLLFVHGLGEHSGRYRNPVDYFVPRGWACYSGDLRGHGRSPGRQVHVRSFDEYALDVDSFEARVRELHPELPRLLVGHSMGGLVAIRYALSHADAFDAAVISSPGLGTHPALEPPRVLKAIATVLSRLAPRTLFASNLDTEAISRDPEVVAAYRADPLVSSKVSARWYTSMMAAMADAHARAGELRLPMLVMQSGADRLVDPEATRRWAEAAPPELVELVVWEGFYHEMMNEPEKERVFAKMEEWLDGTGLARALSCPLGLERPQSQ